MEPVPPSSMQDNQVEKASETCVQNARDDRQTERSSRSQIERLEHENGPPGMARVMPVEGVTKLQRDDVNPCGPEDPQGCLGQ